MARGLCGSVWLRGAVCFMFCFFDTRSIFQPLADGAAKASVKWVAYTVDYDSDESWSTWIVFLHARPYRFIDYGEVGPRDGGGEPQHQWQTCAARATWARGPVGCSRRRLMRQDHDANATSASGIRGRDVARALWVRLHGQARQLPVSPRERVPACSSRFF